MNHISLRKLFSAFLVFFLFLFLQTISGIFAPVKLTLTPPFLKTQKAFAAGETWYNASWTYRKKITIDHTKVASDSANFPVLVSLDSLSHINANGTDIRFTSSDGITELPREIESYSTGSLRAWVKTPTLSSSSDTAIYMYYGNAAATEPAASSTYGSQNVWKTDGVDTSAAMVQHLKENPSGSAPQMIDSTSNANNATSSGAMVTGDQVAGQIDGSLHFDGTNDYVNAGNKASLNIGHDTGFVSQYVLNTSTEDAWGWSYKLDADTIMLITRQGPGITPESGDGKIVKNIYTISTNTWSGYTTTVSYTHLRAHETRHDLVCRLLLEKK